MIRANDRLRYRSLGFRQQPRAPVPTEIVEAVNLVGLVPDKKDILWPQLSSEVIALRGIWSSRPINSQLGKKNCSSSAWKIAGSQ